MRLRGTDRKHSSPARSYFTTWRKITITDKNNIFTPFFPHQCTYLFQLEVNGARRTDVITLIAL